MCWGRLHSTACNIYGGKKNWRTSQQHRTSGFLMRKVMGWENRCPGPKLSLSRIISSADAQDWIPLVDNQQDGHTKSALAVSAFWRFCISDELLRLFWEKTFFPLVKKKKKKWGKRGRRRNRWTDGFCYGKKTHAKKHLLRDFPEYFRSLSPECLISDLACFDFVAWSLWYSKAQRFNKSFSMC